MPQLANVTLTDRKGTPVVHTFTPENIASGVGTVVESSGIPAGSNRLSISLGKQANNRYKPNLRFSFPVVQTETVNGVSRPVIVRTAYATVEFSFDSTSTEAERNDVVGMVADSLGVSKTVVNDTVVKLQGVY